MRLARAPLFTTFILLVLSSMVAFSQITQLPPPPSIADPAHLADIFQATRYLQEKYQAVEFKERIAFRLAAVLPEGREGRNNRGGENRNIDFRQSADYLVIVRPGKDLERKLIKTEHSHIFNLRALYKQIDIPRIQETLPDIASLKTGLLTFVTSEYVNGYKELGHEKVNKVKAIKLALRFRPGRLSIDDCTLWVDEQYHIPIKAEIKLGTIGRYENVLVRVLHENVMPNSLPTSISQEIDCTTYEGDIPLRLEHNSTYSEIHPLTDR